MQLVISLLLPPLHRPLYPRIRHQPDHRHQHVERSRDPLAEERAGDGHHICQERKLALEVLADGHREHRSITVGRSRARRVARQALHRLDLEVQADD